MPYNPARHHRRSIRLRGHDYTRAGAYFVTICVQNRECLFGNVVDGNVRLNGLGRIAAECWEWLAEQYFYVELDEWVVMPNHLHGIIVIHSRTAPRRGDRGP
jgi:putative transposase